MAPEAWEAWCDDLDVVLNPEGLEALLDRAGAARIGFRALRDLMAAGG